MNHVAAIVIALVIIGLLIAFLAGMAAIIGDLYREYDDRDQEEYIRRWMEEKRKLDARKKTRHWKR